MAKALKCDICGSLYEPYNGVSVDTKGNGAEHLVNVMTFGHENPLTGNYVEFNDMDICPVCAKAIKEVIEERRGK